MQIIARNVTVKIIIPEEQNEISQTSYKNLRNKYYFERDKKTILAAF